MDQASLPTPEEIERVKSQILEREEFRVISRDSHSLLKSILDQVGDWLSDLGNWSHASPIASRVLVILLVVVLIALLAHLVYTLVSEVGRIRVAGAGNLPVRQNVYAPLEGQAENWDDALRQARAALDAGDAKRAVWFTHRLLLSLLCHKAAIHFARWKTNNDYLGECAADHPDFPLLSELSDFYERLIYAHRGRDLSRLGALLNGVQQVKAAL